MNLLDSLLGRLRGEHDADDATGWPAAAPSPHATRELVLYEFETCPYCRRVDAVLERLELEVERRDVLLERDARTTLLERTGRTTVPCLFIDDEALFESADIIAWLREHARWRAQQHGGDTA